ncbi:hypothetical protein DSECCO2_67990 [anaerobic digester metagenome]
MNFVVKEKFNSGEIHRKFKSDKNFLRIRKLLCAYGSVGEGRTFTNRVDIVRIRLIISLNPGLFSSFIIISCQIKCLK